MAITSTLSRERLCDVIVRHTSNVCRTMLSLELTPQAPGTPATVDGDAVVALIGLTGTWNGSGTIACSGDVARLLSGRMLMTEFAVVDPEVLDAMGELANMIVGNVKEDMARELGPLAISTPTVIHGKGLQTRSVDGDTDARVRFDCEGGVLDVRVSLVSAK